MGEVRELFKLRRWRSSSRSRGQRSAEERISTEPMTEEERGAALAFAEALPHVDNVRAVFPEGEEIEDEVEEVAGV